MLNRDGNTPLHEQKQAKPKPNQHDRIKLGCRLYKHLHGSADIGLADDDHGRSWLLAFVLCGFNNKALIADAPWLLADDKLRALRREARALRFEDIGLLIHLTDKDRTDCKAWRFFPWNVAPSERDAWLAAKRRAQRQAVDRRRYQRFLDQQAMPNLTEKRREVIERMLEGRPQTLGQLTKRARRSPAFGLHYGNRRSAEAIRKLVYTTAKALAARGRAALMTRKGVYGPVILVSLPPSKARRKAPRKAGKLFRPSRKTDFPASLGGSRKRANGLGPISHPPSLSRFAGHRSGVTNQHERHTRGPSLGWFRPWLSRPRGTDTESRHQHRHRGATPAVCGTATARASPTQRTARGWK